MLEMGKIKNIVYRQLHIEDGVLIQAVETWKNGVPVGIEWERYMIPDGSTCTKLVKVDENNEQILDLIKSDARKDKDTTR